jgi:hypothetical protein
MLDSAVDRANQGSNQDEEKRQGPAGTGILVGAHGPQVIRSKGQRWSDEAEEKFLDQLAASCNVSAAAEAAGFTRYSTYKRRRRDPAFARRWQAAIEQGYARIEAMLVERASNSLEGFAPDPDTPIPQMSVKEILAVLANHRRTVQGGPRSRRQWTRPRSLDEMRDSILAKLEAVAPVSDARSFETTPQTASSASPQDERDGDAETGKNGG